MRPLALLVIALATGCYDSEPPSGTLLCGSHGECPSGQYCAADNRCWLVGDGPDLSSNDDMGGFLITPQSAVLTLGKPKQFSAAGVSVAWSVLEPGGGTIDSSGRYHAPEAAPTGLGPGTYHVVATRTSDGFANQATIEVRDYGAELVAGGLGGSGSLDTSGTGASKTDRVTGGGSVSVDPTGKIWLADAGAWMLRTISENSAGWSIASIIGRPGWGNTNASILAPTLQSPRSSCFDASTVTSYVWAADASAANIIKFTPSGGYQGQSKIANPPNTFFKTPVAIVVDDSGRRYVADAGNHTISYAPNQNTLDYAFYAGTDNTSGFSDSGGGAFNSPMGLAVRTIAAVTKLYVADSGNHAIRTVIGVPPSVTVATLAGTGTAGANNGDVATATFNDPRAVAVDAAGVVYVADRGNHVIRKIEAGQVSTFAGAAGSADYVDGAVADARFNSPTGVALSPDGTRVYVLERDNAVVRMIEGGVVTTVAGRAPNAGNKDGLGDQARFSRPLGLWVDDGGILVADPTNLRIAMVDGTGNVTTLTPSTQFVDDMAVSPGNPVAIVKDSHGALYVADRRHGVIWKMDPGMAPRILAGAYVFPPNPQGGAKSVVGPGATARFIAPVGLAIGPGDVIYVGDENANVIRKMDTDGNVSEFVGTVGNADGAQGVGAAAHFSAPSYLAVAADGTLYVGDTGEQVVRRVTPVGEASLFAGNYYTREAAEGAATTDDTTNMAAFTIIGGVAVDSTGVVYVADSGSHRVLGIRERADGTRFVTKLYGHTYQGGVALLSPANGALNAPTGLAITPEDDLLVLSENSLLRLRVPYPAP